MKKGKEKKERVGERMERKREMGGRGAIRKGKEERRGEDEGEREKKITFHS